MKTVKLAALAALALLALGALMAPSASATDENTPQLLVLAGEAKELEATLKGGESKLEDLAGKTFRVTATTATLNKCTNEAGKAKDTTLCQALLTLTGFKKEQVNCRSETLAKAKDAIETILEKLAVHFAAGLNLPVSDELVPIFTAQILGVDGATDLEINCGGVIVKVLGVLACAAGPGLVNTSKLEVLCKILEKTHDAEKPDCTVLCEAFGPIGVKSTLGVEPNDAWESIHLEGEANKDFFIDD
jgi:hypothetical protein